MTNIFPQAPMPPGQGGPFDDVPMGDPIHMDDFHQPGYGNRRSNSPGPFGYDADSDGLKGKKVNKKKGNLNRALIEVQYEGYILEKADPLPGEKASWGRVGKRTLPWDQKKLQDIVKQHRQKTRQSPQRDFDQLSSNQQGIVNRLIAERKLDEKSKNADWILADVQRMGKWGWTSMEVKKLQIILKRQDKYHATKTKDQSKGHETKSYQSGEILDLESPLVKKRNKNKNVRRTQSLDELDNLDDRGFGMPSFQPPPPPPGNPFPQQMPLHDPFGGPMNIPPPPPGPPGNVNMPFDQHGPGPFPPQPPLARRQSERAPHFDNPFQPDPPFNAPGQFDEPSLDGEDYQYGPNGPRARTRSKSQRRDSTSRPRLDTRRFSQLEDKVDELLRSRMQNTRINDSSSEDTFEDDSVFSRQNTRDRDFSPPSSPRSHFSRGSLERTKSGTRPRYRSHRYSDAEIEPAYSYRDNHRYSPDSRRRSSRPKLYHSQTYDDYPTGRAAEPRYLPAPPKRLTDFEERYDYEDDYDRRGQRDGRSELSVTRHRSPQRFDSFQEGYEAARREIGRDRRNDRRDDRDRHRRTSMVGSSSGGRRYWD